VIDPARWTRAQVDERVAAWNRDLRIASQNILELMEDVSYRSLVGDDGLAAGALRGVTAQEVTPVIAALDELWQVLPALTRVIDEVNERYRRLPWFKDTQPLWEIQQQLEGDSVELTTKTTYAQRGLLTPEEVTRNLRPDRVLAAMVEAYAHAKAVVVEVGDAARRAGVQLREAADELAALTAAVPDSPELAPLADKLAAGTEQLATDPLGLAGVLERDVMPALARLGREIEDARDERARLEAELAGAGDKIAALQAALAEAIASHDERRAKVVLDHEPPAPFAHSVVDELTRWRDRLRHTLAAGRWQAVKLGVANWSTQLAARLAECRRVTYENRRPVERRHELRGLLDGFRAKAADTGLAEDPTVTELYRRAHALLYARPTPLLAAEQLVADYVAAVR
jgi:hypothetical protein